MGIKSQDEMICILAEYIIERPNENFSLRMGHFHGDVIIVYSSQPMKELREYLGRNFDQDISDHNFCGIISEFLMSIYQRQNDYKRNIFFGSDGSLEITDTKSFKASRAMPRLPSLSVASPH